MNASFVYMPVFRVRTYELEVLKSFHFGNRICPYIEIVKEKDRARKMTHTQLFKSLILAINSPTVFVDIPIHFKSTKRTNPDVIGFLTPMRNIEKRNSALKNLGPMEKMVPVISSYHSITGETGSIKKQVEALRPSFQRLAFRISSRDSEFESELEQVIPFLSEKDHLIIDFGEDFIDLTSNEIADINTALKEITVCPIVALRSAIPNDIKYKDFEDDEEIQETDNRLMQQYRLLNTSAFGDYAGIKKDLINKGVGSEKTIYGCVYYDATTNCYFGYRASSPGFDAVKQSVVPKVIDSDATERMRQSKLDFLAANNKGWELLNDLTINQPGIMKRISMEHYLHCIKTMIDAGMLD